MSLKYIPHQGIGAPQSGEHVCGRSKPREQPSASENTVTSRVANNGVSDRLHALRPEFMEALRRGSNIEHPPACLPKTSGMKMFGESIRKELHFQSVFLMHPITKLDVLNRSDCERLIEWVLPEKLCFQGQIARVEMLPVGRSAPKQISISELQPTRIEPSHKSGHSLSRFAPARQAKSGDMAFRPALM